MSDKPLGEMTARFRHDGLRRLWCRIGKVFVVVVGAASIVVVPLASPSPAWAASADTQATGASTADATTAETAPQASHPTASDDAGAPDAQPHAATASAPAQALPSRQDGVAHSSATKGLTRGASSVVPRGVAAVCPATPLSAVQSSPGSTISVPFPWTLASDGAGGCALTIGASTGYSYGSWTQAPDGNDYRQAITSVAVTGAVRLEPIPQSDGSFSYPTTALFANMPNMVEFTGIGHIDMSNMLDAGQMFRGDVKFTPNVAFFNDFDTSKVQNMKEMFYGCSELFDDDDINGALDSALFADDGSGGFSFASATCLEGMFFGCDSLESIDLTGLNASEFSHVTTVKLMFSDCSSLSEATLSGDFTAVTDMTSLFDGCSSLSQLTLADGFRTSSNLKHVDSLFNDSALPAFDVGYLMPDASGAVRLDLFGVQTATDMFYGDDGFTGFVNMARPADPMTIDLPQATDVSGMFDSCHSLTTLVSPLVGRLDPGLKPSDVSLTFNLGSATNMHGMFSSSGLTTFAAAVNAPNVTDMSYMFQDCYSLEAVVTKNVDIGSAGAVLPANGANPIIPNAVTLKGMFEDCGALETVRLYNPGDATGGKFNLTRVYDIDDMFHNVGTATLSGFSLDLRGINAMNIRTMKSAFQSCSVHNLNFTGMDLRSVQRMDYLFASSTLATYVADNLALPSIVSMAHMFDTDTALTKVKAINLTAGPDFTNTEYMFNRCTGLKTLDGGEAGLPTQTVRDLDHMFADTAIERFTTAGFKLDSAQNVSYLFWNDSHLDTFIVEQTANLRSLNDVSHLLDGCIHLRSLDLSGITAEKTPNLLHNASQVQDMFAGLGKLNWVRLDRSFQYVPAAMGNMTLNYSDVDADMLQHFRWVMCDADQNAAQAGTQDPSITEAAACRSSSPDVMTWDQMLDHNHEMLGNDPANPDLSGFPDQYATYELRIPVKFVFEPNGGTGTMDPVYAIRGKATPLNNTFTYVGHSFGGWKDVSGGETYSTQYTPETGSRSLRYDAADSDVAWRPKTITVEAQWGMTVTLSTLPTTGSVARWWWLAFLAAAMVLFAVTAAMRRYRLRVVRSARVCEL